MSENAVFDSRTSTVGERFVWGFHGAKVEVLVVVDPFHEDGFKYRAANGRNVQTTTRDFYITWARSEADGQDPVPREDLRDAVIEAAETFRATEQEYGTHSPEHFEACCVLAEAVDALRSDRQAGTT